jgi:hypothetical protein
LGGWNPVMGNAEEQKAVFMHELGHNFNLNHGGSDSIQYKPNYFSVMNPSFQFISPDPNITYDLDPCRPLDYSRKAMNTLNEVSLSESAGVKDPSGAGYLYPTAPWSCSKSWTGNAAGASLADQTTPVNVASTQRFFWYSTPGSSTLDAFDRTNQGVNWNNDVPPDDSDTVTNQDINKEGGSSQQLISIDDWSRVISNFDFGNSDYSKGASAGNVTDIDFDTPPYHPEDNCEEAPDVPPLFGGSFTTGCNEIEAIEEELVVHPFLAPHKQVNEGTAPEDVQCNNDRHLVIRLDKPACVSDAAFTRLVSQGWTEIKKQ